MAEQRAERQMRSTRPSAPKASQDKKPSTSLRQPMGERPTVTAPKQTRTQKLAARLKASRKGSGGLGTSRAESGRTKPATTMQRLGASKQRSTSKRNLRPEVYRG